MLNVLDPGDELDQIERIELPVHREIVRDRELVRQRRLDALEIARSNDRMRSGSMRGAYGYVGIARARFSPPRPAASGASGSPMIRWRTRPRFGGADAR
jgi:hypothetical protein